MYLTDYPQELIHTPEYLNFEENFLNTMRKFEFEKMEMSVIEDVFINKPELKEEVFNFACSLIDFDIENFKEEIYNKIQLSEEELSTKQGLKTLINDQQSRLKSLIIEFIYQQLPLNYLIKISKKVGKYNLKHNIRENIIELIENDIEKIGNADNMLNSISDHLDAKDQKTKFKILVSKLANKNHKVTMEFKFLIYLINETSLEKLENLVDTYMDNKFLFGQMY